MKSCVSRRVRSAARQLVEHLESRCLLSAAVLSEIPGQQLFLSGAPATVNLSTFLGDPQITGGTLIEMQTPLGNIPLQLSDSATPNTVANFLTYINNGQFTPTMIQRSVPGFVLQGGGTKPDGSDNNPVASLNGEPGISNTAGTIAMALNSSGPDSGTNQWFINLVDNNGTGDTPDLDDTSDGGPFTAFGNVIDNGLDVANQIAALQTIDASAENGAWDTLPVVNYTGDSTVSSIAPGNIVTDNIVQIAPSSALSYSVLSANPALVTASISNGVLTLAIAPGVTTGGQTTVSATVTDLSGATASANFVVDVSGPLDHLSVVGGATVQGGAPLQLNANPQDANNNAIIPSAGQLVWNSSDPAVATVDATGLVTALARGSTQITVTDSQTSIASAPITVTAISGSLNHIDLTPPGGTLAGGEQLQFTTNPLDVGDNPVVVAVGNLVWNSSDPTVATVDETGLVTAVAHGSAQITATDSATSIVSSPVTVSVTHFTTRVTLGAGGGKSMTYVDADGTTGLFTLKGSGSAVIDFQSDSVISSATSRQNAISVTSQDGLSIADITITGSAANSILTITTRGGTKAIEVGAITTGTMKSITGKGVTLSGNLTSTGSIASLAIAAALGGTISANSIGTLITTGSFADALQLSSAAVSLKKFTASSITGGTWSTGGSVATITARSTSNWTAALAGSVTALSITGDLSGTLSAGSIKTLKVGGNLSATIAATSLGSVMVKKNFSNSAFAISGAGMDLGKLTVGGAITGTTINATGGIGAISATSLVASQLDAGVSNPVAGQLPADRSVFSNVSIASVTLKTFVSGQIAASSLGKLSLGTISTSNAGNETGIASEQIVSFKAIANRVHLSQKSITSNAELSGITPNIGDFIISLL